LRFLKKRFNFLFTMDPAVDMPFNPEKAETFLELGEQLLYEIGRIDDAENALKTALDLLPNNTYILMELAVAYALQDEDESAIEILKQVIELAEDEETLAEAHLRLGIAYDTIGNETLATVELEILRGLDEDRARVLEEIMETGG